jgi:hypothetical protein
MPRALEPGVKIPVVLDYDKGKTPEPTFYIRSFSMRENREVAEMVDAIQDSENASDLHNRVTAVLEKVIVDWANMGRPFDIATIENVLTFAESQELIAKVLQAQALDVDDKKKSELPL